MPMTEKSNVPGLSSRLEWIETGSMPRPKRAVEMDIEKTSRHFLVEPKRYREQKRCKARGLRDVAV
jgi:hypothetical protein